MPDLSISAVIVFHSDLTKLADTVESLRGQAQEIIVIDVSPSSATLNLVPDGTVAYFPQPANHGYGWACNIGIAAATSDMVLISNPDVVYLDDSVARLAEVAMLGHLCGPVQFKGQSPDRSIDESESLQLGISMAASLNRWLGVGRKKFAITRKKIMLNDDGVTMIRTSRLTLSGASLMASKSTWKRLGGFDERYFLYQEDADLCVRAHRIGVPVSLVRTARMAHLSGSSRRGLDDSVVQWAMQSEHLAWEAHDLPTHRLMLIRSVGVSARMIASLARGNFHDSAIWARALGKATDS